MDEKQESHAEKRVRVKPMAPGTLIAGRVEILQPLSIGDFVHVYLAHDHGRPDRSIAIKILMVPSFEGSALIKARFENEIRASHRVRHQNVVRTYDYLEGESLIAYTMEYFPGGDLASLLDRHGQLPISRALDIIVQLCDGLRAIHSAGIVHRDIKPENIMVADNGVVKISDFGIARMGTTLGKGRSILGTITYLSPEYLRDGQLDQRSDIYSAGIVAHELLTGKVPVEGDSVIEIMQKQVQGKHRPVHELNPFCPMPLSRIISKALQVDPERRYQSGGEMLDELLLACKAIGVAPSSSSLSTVYDEESYGGSSARHPIVYEPEQVVFSPRLRFLLVSFGVVSGLLLASLLL